MKLSIEENYRSMRKTYLFVVFVAFFAFTANAQYRFPPDKDLKGYLFVYFTGNAKQDEQIHFAISKDGFHYFALNDNEPVLNSAEISSTGGVRDPHILRTQDGRHYYMVATDMVSGKGWNSNRAMVLLKSDNLTDWTHSVVNIQKKYENQEDLKRVWAPQTIYDREKESYMIYWSMKYGNGPDVIYYAYANKDFTDLKTKPQPLIPKNKKSCIDGDIIYKNGIYHLFYKTEGHGNGIKHAMTDNLTSGNWITQDDYKQQTKDPVEGSSIFKLNHTDKYILMYDVYTKGRFEFTISCDLDQFHSIDDEMKMDFHPRHGSVLPITASEMRHLTETYGVPDGYSSLTHHNPIIEGYFADPDILYSHKTGKYYLYPTSDGYTGWSGRKFRVFSSKNLKDWQYENVILDLTKDVSWANDNAWAPTIIERKRGNQYKYYFYFTAKQKIGVAVSDQPTGPFKDSGKPLIAHAPEGINRGQEIDPMVFHDKVHDKYYLYWGNGYAAVAELNEDMVSIKKNSIKIITPDGTFREGIYVFYRKGKYYFMWSENDTRSPDYSVRYGVSDSPVGPIKVPEDNIVIQKDPSKGIYGTGHNSVIRRPGTDDWYMIYHRFSIPNGIKMGRAAGYHREVCMDKMEFTEEGKIKQVHPSL